MVFQAVIMAIGAAGAPGALVAGLVEGEKKEDTAPAITLLRLRGAETALGIVMMPIIAILKTVFLVTPQIEFQFTLI